MTYRKFKKIFKSGWSKLIFSLIFLSVVLLITFFWFFKSGDKENSKDNINYSSDDLDSINQFDVYNNLSISIDSILQTYGINNEWLKNDTNRQSKSKEGKQKFKLFTKSVSVPSDMNLAEINLDISDFLRNIKLGSVVTEDFKTKNLMFLINDRDSAIPLAIIHLTYSNKIFRHSSKFILIFDKLRDYTEKERDDVLRYNGFSYLFQPDIDDIEFHSKLSEIKQNIVVNFTVGSKDSEADFKNNMSEKDINQKIKYFKNDHPGFKYILLTGSNTDYLFYKNVLSEFKKNQLNVIQDSLLTFITSADDKNLFEDMLKKLYILSNQKKNIITVLNLSYYQFKEFHNHVLKLKRLGHKFITVSEYLELEEKERKKQEQLLQKKQEEIKQTNISKDKKTDIKSRDQKTKTNKK